MKSLRILRARLMFRWIWQDANQQTDVVTLTRELSDFADASICAAKRFALGPLLAKHGEPLGYSGEVQDLIVIGMGKLGAQELNLSSDIDLILPSMNKVKRRAENPSMYSNFVFCGDKTHLSARSYHRRWLCFSC